MYDQSFTKKTLNETIKNSDHYRIKNLDTEKDTHLDEAYDKAHKLILGNYFPLKFTSPNKNAKNKTVFVANIFSDKLILRKITRNIKVITRCKQSDRNSIVKNLLCFLEENVQYRVYRKDIKDFYGSISTASLEKKLQENGGLSRHTVKALSNLFCYFSKFVSGLPRGIQTSVILAEYVMSEFDDAIRNHPDVFFYARFVDDILIVTNGNEDVNKFNLFLQDNIPNGLAFNTSLDKCQTESILKHAKKQNSPPSFISFLGYCIEIQCNGKKKNEKRIVNVDISESKVKKFKTKIMKAFMAFFKDFDFDLLNDRIKLLTSNYYILDKDKNSKQTAGIYYSYKYITVKPDEKKSQIKGLDNFLLNVVLSGKGRVSVQLKQKLTKKQKRKILSHTFVRGFERKIIHHYNNKRMSEITKCWKYGC